MTDIPAWAFDRVDKLAAEGRTEKTAFAKYISEHEEAPVDPLLVEAVNAVYDMWRRGSIKRDMTVKEAITRAVKRGIEIGAAK